MIVNKPLDTNQKQTKIAKVFRNARDFAKRDVFGREGIFGREGVLFDRHYGFFGMEGPLRSAMRNMKEDGPYINALKLTGAAIVVGAVVLFTTHPGFKILTRMIGGEDNGLKRSQERAIYRFYKENTSKKDQVGWISFHAAMHMMNPEKTRDLGTALAVQDLIMLYEYKTGDSVNYKVSETPESK